jgi:hypothetical protein
MPQTSKSRVHGGEMLPDAGIQDTYFLTGGNSAAFDHAMCSYQSVTTIQMPELPTRIVDLHEERGIFDAEKRSLQKKLYQCEGVAEEALHEVRTLCSAPGGAGFQTAQKHIYACVFAARMHSEIRKDYDALLQIYDRYMEEVRKAV